MSEMDLLAALMAWTMAFTGMHTEGMPAVETVTKATMQEIACKNDACGDVFGFYRWGEHKVLLAEGQDLTTAVGASHAVHEFVHYLQDRTGKRAAAVTCEEQYDIERQAYLAERTYLQTRGVYLPMAQQLRTYLCDLTRAGDAR